MYSYYSTHLFCTHSLTHHFCMFRMCVTLLDKCALKLNASSKFMSFGNYRTTVHTLILVTHSDHFVPGDDLKCSKYSFRSHLYCLHCTWQPYQSLLNAYIRSSSFPFSYASCFSMHLICLPVYLSISLSLSIHLFSRQKSTFYRFI